MEKNSSPSSQSGVTPGTGIDLDRMLPGDRPHILVIDDEPDTITLVKRFLMLEGYDVAGASSGKEGLEKLAIVNPNIILLDLLMPGMDGWETLATLRKLSTVPVIIFSALDRKDDIIRGLHEGADDYITKPFFKDEVVARVESVLRRTSPAEAHISRLVFPNLQLIIDLKSQELEYNDQRIQLTGKMFEVLMLLASQAPHVVKYDELALRIWGVNSVAARNRLKYLVYLLRKKFEEVNPDRQVILNVDRLGYKLLSEG